MTDHERPERGLSRRAVTLLAGVAIVVTAVGLTVALGVGPSNTIPATAAPRASAVAPPAFGDLPLVTVAPAATGSPAASPPGVGSPVATASPVVTASPVATAGHGIPASRIRIASVGIDLAIIEGDGLDAPIGKVAHYPGSAWPGGGSNIYIYGHARAGMFLPLWQVKIGDKVQLGLVDGTSRTYVVTKVLPKVPYNALQYVEPTKTEQLTLQTCTSYSPTAPRFIVIAVPQA